MQSRKIGLGHYLAYGSGDFLGAGTTALTAAWLLYFHTTFCGLSPIEATFIFAAARVLDAVVSPLMGFLTDNFALLLPISAFAGLGRGGINNVPCNTYTYIADVDEVITGQHREGIFAGIMTLTRKASQASAVMIVGIMLQLAGFTSGKAEQAPAVGHTMLLTLSVGPVGVLICGFIVSLRFKLNRHTHTVLREETMKMREAGQVVPERITPQARTIVETLAGIAYGILKAVR